MDSVSYIQNKLLRRSDCNGVPGFDSSVRCRAGILLPCLYLRPVSHAYLQYSAISLSIEFGFSSPAEEVRREGDNGDGDCEPPAPKGAGEHDDAIGVNASDAMKGDDEERVCDGTGADNGAIGVNASDAMIGDNEKRGCGGIAPKEAGWR